MGVVDGFVVDRLVQAQLPLLLRLALDDTVEAVVKMAALTMHSLMVVHAEEVRVAYGTITYGLCMWVSACVCVYVCVCVCVCLCVCVCVCLSGAYR